MTRRIWVLLPILGLAGALRSTAGPIQAGARPPEFRVELKRAHREALEKISADSMRGHLSFLASDALEGRGTPSRGLDIAAEYIAAQFRRARLEPGGERDYFQTNLVTPRGTTTPASVHNVIGVLRGSDPALRDTGYLLTAHYDHLGSRPVDPENLRADVIFNGANDDGSGTVSVIEIAAALASLKERPRRSLVFIAFYGEERGLLGSRYYGAHPTFPLSGTLGQINLEQVGRTDDTEGPRVNAASMTGFDYSDLGGVFAAAGKKLGVEVSGHPRNSDSFFGRSDNQALAELGVPAHTLCTSFMFPDYHRPGDHWDKVDYENMARVDRMVALGLLTLANSPREPRWNSENGKAQRYLEAWRARQPPAQPRTGM